MAGTSPLFIVPLTAPLAASAAAVEAASSSTPWSTATILDELHQAHCRAWAALDGKTIVGFIFARILPPEAEILRIAVVPEKRRMGTARTLLLHAMEYLKANGVNRVFLEVRAGNDPARGLYVSSGFRECGIRKNYYRSPDEDAVLMERLI